MVTVSISETFDISTKINKMSLIAVHSPTKTLIQKTYPGLAMNHKYFKIKKVDVSLVATSHLPVNPAEVGDTADKIAPQDMLNPILYKAVSNDSWNTLESRLAGLLYRPVPGADTPSVVGNMATAENEGLLSGGDFGVYYTLLSNRDGFKLAHPQQGMSMKGLKPLVFEKWFTNAVNKDPGSDQAPIIYEKADHTMAIGTAPNNSMRGRPHPMPRLNTTYLTGIHPGTSGTTLGTNEQSNGMGDGLPRNNHIQMPNVDPVMLACIILPPSARTIMYYRMICRCYIEFSDLRPITEITSFTGMSDNYSAHVYHSDYTLQSAKMDHVTDMVDTNDADIEKIMEGR